METAAPSEIIIRAETSDDAAAIVEMMNQPSVRWGTLDLPYSSLSHYQKRQQNRLDTITALVACINDRPVGAAGLYRSPQLRRHHAAGIGIMVHDAHQGHGIGRLLMSALIDLADNWLDLKRLELKVFIDNQRAISLYEKFGFVEEGTHRADSFRDGKYVDSYSMSRIHGMNPVQADFGRTQGG